MSHKDTDWKKIDYQLESVCIIFPSWPGLKSLPAANWTWNQPQKSRECLTDDSTDGKIKAQFSFTMTKKNDNELGPQSIVATDPASLWLCPDKSKKS
jgi:hypothetical protein